MGTAIPHPQDIRTVAIRLTNWVGDVVMNTPFILRVREIFPQARLIVLGRKNVASLLEGHPAVDDVWVIDDKSTGGFLKAARQLREARVEIGFLLPNSLHSASLFLAGRVRWRIGYDRDSRRMLLTHPIALRPEDLAVHEVNYYLRLLKDWDTGGVRPRLQLAVSEAEQAHMAAYLDERGIDRNDFIVGVNPAAFYGTAKRWLPERFADVAKQLMAERGGWTVVTGLKQERDVAEEVCRAGGERFINAAGEMSLRELMAFLARADIFLTNDSGAMHIAAALNTPLVAVFGSTDWVTTAPLSDKARIVRAATPCAPCLLRHCPIDHRCMKDVTAEMVGNAARDLMAV